MSKALIVSVKENNQELRILLKKYIPFLQPRIKFLFELKRHIGTEVSKWALMEATDLCNYSVHKWRTLYNSGGLYLLLQPQKKGLNLIRYNIEQHKKLEEKLYNSEKGIRGYKEFQLW